MKEKKNYMEPRSEVFDLHVNAPLLAGSVYGIGGFEGSGGPDSDEDILMSQTRK